VILFLLYFKLPQNTNSFVSSIFFMLALAGKSNFENVSQFDWIYFEKLQKSYKKNSTVHFKNVL
jgi:hypothetical protein